MSKIPKKAKKVFEGKIFDVYQWKQKLYDSSTAVFEKLKRQNTVQVIATSGSKIFLTHENQPGVERKNGFIGGRIDKGETPLNTAKRELLEEAGMKSNDWKLFAIYEPYSKIDWKIYYYIAKNCSKVSEQKLDAGEKIKIKQASFDQFIKIISSPGFDAQEFANEVLRMKINGRLKNFRKKIFNGV